MDTAGDKSTSACGRTHSLPGSARDFRWDPASHSLLFAKVAAASETALHVEESTTSKIPRKDNSEHPTRAAMFNQSPNLRKEHSFDSAISSTDTYDWQGLERSLGFDADQSSTAAKFEKQDMPEMSDPSAEDITVRGEEASSTENTEEKSETEESKQPPLSFQIPKNTLRKAMLASSSGVAAYWDCAMYRGPKDERVIVHYCKSLETSEKAAQLFLNEKVLGFDLEWKPNSSTSDGIKKNVSLIQIASETRIALFHVALFKGETPEKLVPPTFRKLMESPEVMKCGVSVMGDCTRLRNHLEIKSQGLIELSHLHKLVNFMTTGNGNTNRRLVRMADVVEEHLQLPLFKGEVRSSDWTKELKYEQVKCKLSQSSSVTPY
jgi:3'-5' exonuclease